MTTGERIKARRKELDLSAEYVADCLGVSAATIYRYEKGDIEKMPTDIIIPLSKVLHTSPMYLMGWSENSSIVNEDPDAAPTRESIAAKLEAVLRQAGYLLPGEQLTPELLSGISVALETAIEIYRKNHK